MVFDKDDFHAVEFVTAAANIRADNFSIAMESLFKIKEMAGKIVPAISSSNALGASLQVFEGIKLLAKQHSKLKAIVYQRKSEISRLNSLSRANEAPNPEC
jgi:ubiquitin-like 1-activating enzyme E1 B